MQFDHLGDKLFTISNAGATSVERLLAEIAKCEVVCANCHAERTYQRTQCRGKDSNLRLTGYEPVTLPNCVTPDRVIRTLPASWEAVKRSDDPIRTDVSGL